MKKIGHVIKTLNLIRFVILGFLIPVTLSFVVYAGFNSAYTSQGFTLSGFMGQFFNGVFRYRILGRSLVLETYNLVKEFNLPLIPTNLGDSQLYSAYFYLNTLFFSLTSITLFFILNREKKDTLTSVDLPLLFTCTLIALSQFVVVPYDTLSYFLLALCALLILHQKKTIWNTVTLCVLVVLSTLTRESAVLILALYFSVNYRQILVKPAKFKFNIEQTSLLAITGFFAATYLALRLRLGFSQSIFQNVTLAGNSNLLSFLGALFLICITFLFLAPKDRSKESLLFTLTSLPYLIPMFLIAVTWEIRLWVPFLMLLLLLVLRKEKDIPQATN